METKEMEAIYQRIANLLNEMVPEVWDKILLYAEIREGYSQVFFYYFPDSKIEPIYSLDIPDLFHIDKGNQKKWKLELYESCRDLWKQFRNNMGEEWSSLTFILDRSGTFKTAYEYNDLSQISTVDKKRNWEAKYLV